MKKLKLVYVFTFILALLAAIGCDSNSEIASDIGLEGDTSTVDVSDAEDTNLGASNDASDLKDSAIDLDMNASCESGCITKREFVGTFLRRDINAAVPTNVIVANGYSIYWITFKTNGRLARASVTIPDGVEVPDGGWPIAVNNPGTVGLADKCAVAFSISGSGLSGYFGARGWVGVAVDYPGLATAGIHPYLVSEIEGKASLDAVRATKNLLEAREIPFSGAAIISGLSQGGHATLAAASLQKTYAPELDIRAYALAGPASVFQEHWQPGILIEGPHLAYHAMVTYAWRAEYGSGESPWTLSLDTKIDQIMDEHCNYPTDTTSLDVELGGVNTEIFNQKFIDAFSQGDFSSYPFMRIGFEKNRLRGFQTDVPIRIYQGDLDEVVLRQHTDELVAELKTRNPNIEYITVPNGHHTDVAFSFLGVEQLRTEEVLSWLKERVK